MRCRIGVALVKGKRPRTAETLDPSVSRQWFLRASEENSRDVLKSPSPARDKPKREPSRRRLYNVRLGSLADMGTNWDELFPVSALPQMDLSWTRSPSDRSANQSAFTPLRPLFQILGL